MRIFSESSFLTARWGMCVCVGGGGWSAMCHDRMRTQGRFNEALRLSFSGTIVRCTSR